MKTGLRELVLLLSLCGLVCLAWQILFRARTQSVFLEPKALSITFSSQESDRETSVEIKNQTSKSLAVVGFMTDCRCLKAIDLPENIPSRGAGQLKLRVLSTASRGSTVSYIVATDSIEFPFLEGNVAIGSER